MNVAVQRLLTRLTEAEPRRLIALAGLPGSGKTRLAAHIATAVNDAAGPGIMVALGMDGFHLTQAQLQRMPDPEAAFARRGAPWTFDVAALAARLRMLRDAAGRELVAWPVFQHEVGDPIEGAHVVQPGTRLVLVEGLYLLLRGDGWDAVSERFDERWYLDTPYDVSMSRLVERHMQAWGIDRAAAQQRVATNDRLNADIVLSTRPWCDWRIAPG